MRQGYESDRYIETYLGDGVLRFQDTSLLSCSLNEDYCDLRSVYPFSEADIDEYDLRGFISAMVISNPLKPFRAPIDSITAVYKQHSVVDLQKYDPDKLPENCRRILKKSKLEIHNLNPTQHTDRVAEVYKNLIQRHQIQHTTDYTRRQFDNLLIAEGAVLLGNWHQNEYIGFNLYYISGEDVYYHLSAQTEASYALKSNHQMMNESILMFKSMGFGRLLLGSVPDGGSEGLKRFKTAYSHYERQNFISKKLINPSIYAKLSEGMEGNFFPLYRSSQ